MQINFEPVQLRKANKKLDKHILSASVHKETNAVYKKGIFKESLWHKLLSIFKK
ncbi:MAG: hypothetical protein Q9M36_01870 [Sulfurovum sp.]|nr:hypothetical protein [Sulfurovum sp.]